MAAVQFHSPTSVTHYFIMQVDGSPVEFSKTWALATSPASRRQGCLTPAEAVQWSLAVAKATANLAGASSCQWVSSTDVPKASVLLGVWEGK